jgi:hypothetical protein
MRFEFYIPDGGWAVAAFSAGGRRYEFAVSALSDAPGDLLGAAVGLLRGQDDARVTFMQEPGEVVAVFRRLGGDRLRLKLFHGDDWGEADTERGARLHRRRVARPVRPAGGNRAFSH